MCLFMIYDNDLFIKQMENNLIISGRCPNTINTYTHAVSLLCRFVDKPSHNLTHDDARNFIIHLRHENRLSKATINCYNSCIRYFF